jgi:hypothetical protein
VNDGMKAGIDISHYDTKTQLLFHGVVLLATLVVSAFLCFALFDVPFPFGIFQWVGFVMLGKILYFIAAYVMFGGSFVDPLEKMYEESRRR